MLSMQERACGVLKQTCISNRSVNMHINQNCEPQNVCLVLRAGTQKNIKIKSSSIMGVKVCACMYKMCVDFFTQGTESLTTL